MNYLIKTLSLLLFALPLLLNSAIAADRVERYETCYELSQEGLEWSNIQSLLCIETVKTSSSDGKYRYDYVQRLKRGGETIARFDLKLVLRARCIDCNADVYASFFPVGTALDNFEIQFNGSRSSGVVTIGQQAFNYQRIP